MDNFLDGNPYLYALKDNHNLERKNTKSLYKFLNQKKIRAKNHIIPKNSESGILQYLFFSEMGEQFALKWHSANNQKRIICSPETLSGVISKLSNSELYSADSIGLIKLKDVSPKITIVSTETDFKITWLENRTHSGIYSCCYQIKRHSPYTILKTV